MNTATHISAMDGETLYKRTGDLWQEWTGDQWETVHFKPCVRELPDQPPSPLQVLEYALRQVIRVYVASTVLPQDRINEQVNRIAARYIAEAEAALSAHNKEG